MQSLARRLYAIFIAAALAGCAPFTQYRTDYKLCVNPTEEFSASCAQHALQQFPVPGDSNYLMGFIEFDDQGQLWDRKQMWSVLDRLTTETAKKDLLMVVFVHGWKHSAAPGDDNTDTFRKVLASLSKAEQEISQKSGIPARKVAGIYLGWRGGSVPVAGIQELTFWERKNTAQEVGHGGVTEVLNRLEALKRDKAAIDKAGGRTRLVVVGHSFGGAVVYTALGQILSNRFVRTAGAPSVQTYVEGFGDLVVLINPAFEATLFSPIHDMAMERAFYPPSQLPLMAVLTSENDQATRKAFPIGRTLSTLLEKHRDMTRHNAVTGKDEVINERLANITAIGHFEPYRTHTLRPVKDDAGNKSVKSAQGLDSVLSTVQATAGWENEKPGSTIRFDDVILERTATSAARNPYLVIRVDKELIPNHNDIDDDRIVGFVRNLVLVTTVPDPTKDLLFKSLGVPRSTR